MFKPGDLLRSKRTGSLFVVIGWPLVVPVRKVARRIGVVPGRIGHREVVLVGRNYRSKTK